MSIEMVVPVLRTVGVAVSIEAVGAEFMIAETIADLEDIKAKGMAGAMMPCDPSTEFDYDDVRFDPVWQAAIDLRLPLSFHILTSGKGSKGLLGMSGRGDKDIFTVAKKLGVTL